MPRTDIHTHALHHKIADKVLAQLQEHYGIAPVGTARIEDLLERERAAGVQQVVVLCAATAPAQVIPANNWGISLMQKHPEVQAFGSLHPDFPEWEAELSRLRAAGVRGLKFHPEFQGFWMDDARLLPIIEEAQGDFAFMFHVGDKLPPQKNPSCPFKMASLVRNFPKARMIAAHMGGYLHWPAALEALAGTGVYFDTSSTLPFIHDTLLAELWRRHPRERILFGSDYPLYDPGTEARQLQRRLRLSDAELQELQQNGGRFLQG